MRRLVALILVMFIIFPAKGVRHEMYSKATPSDEGIYIFFSKILKDAESCLDGFLKEDPHALNHSVLLKRKVNLVEDEYRFYTAKGVKSNVSLVLKPFDTLSSEIRKLLYYQSVFLKNIKTLFKDKNNYVAYINARTAVINMRSSANKINDTISKIEGIALWNGISRLYFDVSGIKSKMGSVRDLITYYESLLAKFEFREEYLIVAISNDHPFLYQEVTIYIYAKNVTPTALYIDNIRYKIQNNNIKKYSFKRLGEHIIYAEGVSGGRVVKSNIVRVYVTKIPTYITLSSKSTAFLNEVVKVVGFISDYYGNPLQADVVVKIDGKETTLTTHRGSFSFNITKSSEGYLNITAIYAGNETYRSSNASLSIFFSRFSVLIYIKANKTNIGVNESVGFIGEICGVNYSVPIYIFVNSTKVQTLKTAGKFNFNLSFPNRGNYIIYAYFPGDRLYHPAKSNRIEIVVVSSMYNPYYILLVAVTIVITLAFLFIRSFRVKGKHVEEPKREEAVQEIKETSRKLEIPKSVEDAYVFLFKTLVNKYNLKRSFTPRELLQALKDKPFAEKLKTVTELHERFAYGCAELSNDEKDLFFKLIAEILEIKR